MAHLFTQTGLIWNWDTDLSKLDHLTNLQISNSRRLALLLVKTWIATYPNSGKQLPTRTSQAENATDAMIGSGSETAHATGDFLLGANFAVATTYGARGAGDIPNRSITITGTSPSAGPYVGYVLYGTYIYNNQVYWAPLIMGSFDAPISVSGTPFSVEIKLGTGDITDAADCTAVGYSAAVTAGCLAEHGANTVMRSNITAKWLKGTVDPAHKADYDVLAATLLATCTEQRDPVDAEYWLTGNKSVANDSQQPFYELNVVVSKPTGLTGTPEDFNGLALYRTDTGKMIMLVEFTVARSMSTASAYGASTDRKSVV